jgi:hypothetical protein
MQTARTWTSPRGERVGQTTQTIEDDGSTTTERVSLNPAAGSYLAVTLPSGYHAREVAMCQRALVSGVGVDLFSVATVEAARGLPS